MISSAEKNGGITISSSTGARRAQNRLGRGDRHGLLIECWRARKLDLGADRGIRPRLSITSPDPWAALTPPKLCNLIEAVREPIRDSFGRDCHATIISKYANGTANESDARVEIGIACLGSDGIHDV